MMKTVASKCVMSAAALLVVAAAPRAFGATCESLMTVTLKDATVTRAEVVPPGKFSPPDGGRRGPGRGNAYADLPEFCRVAATLTPSSDSDIKVEVWLPASAQGSGAAGSGWNGKFQAVGNGGWAGVISYAAMGDALRAGY